jgi:hypothetical protein
LRQVVTAFCNASVAALSILPAQSMRVHDPRAFDYTTWLKKTRTQNAPSSSRAIVARHDPSCRVWLSSKHGEMVMARGKASLLASPK